MMRYNMCNSYVEVLKKQIVAHEKEILLKRQIIANEEEIFRIMERKNKTPYRDDADECDKRIYRLREEINKINIKSEDIKKEMHTLNDKIDFDKEIEYRANEAKIWSDMCYTNKTTTETPSTECVHQFCDVYDYQEHIPENIVKEAGRFPSDYWDASIEMLKAGKSITKKYVLTYCKVCGYTINRACTE